MVDLDDSVGTSRSAAPAPSRHLAVLGHFVQDASYTVSRPQGARSWLMTWTIGGTGRLSHRGTTVAARRGDLVVLGPDVPQRYATDAAPWHFWWAHYQPRPQWAALLRPWRVGDDLFQVSVRDPTAVDRVGDAFGRAFSDISPDGPVDDATIVVSSPATTDLVLNAIEEVLLVAGRSADERDDEQDDGIGAALRSIAVNPAATHSVSTLAAVAAMSPSHFAHEFKRRTGRTPMRAVVAERIDVATNLLRTTELPIAQVARAVGFSDPYYFSRVFRRHVGVAPSAYAVQMRGRVAE